MERSQPVVVFDLGEVLVPSAGVMRVLTRELGVRREAIVDAYWVGRHEYDVGGDDDRYWRGVLARLGRQPQPGQVERLTRLDSLAWSQLPSASAAMLAAVAGSGGVRLGLLSNAPVALAAAVRGAGWSGLLDSLVFSADLGLSKPDPRIFAAADETFGSDPADVVFFDDRAQNVAAARAHGWQAHVWVDPPTALAVLAGCGIG